MWIRGGGKNAYPQNVDKKHVFFFNPSLNITIIQNLKNVNFCVNKTLL